MKSIKKRFKLLLAEIKESAQQLALLSADLELLSEIQQITGKVLGAEKTLSLRVSELNKTEFTEKIADCDALSALDEIIDIDAISTLEDCFFAVLDNHADNGIGEFLQQLLAKIDRLYTRMIENIQQLNALLDEE